MSTAQLLKSGEVRLYLRPQPIKNSFNEVIEPDSYGWLPINMKPKSEYKLSSAKKNK